MAPVSPEGFAVVKTFIAWMIGGAVAALVIAILAMFTTYWLAILAPVVFVGCAAYGAWYFISQAQGRGDQQHTVDDYKAGRV
jgi:membrane protein implicated in regulation of membrane protease activity